MNLPDVLRRLGVVIDLLGAELQEVHVELVHLLVEHVLEAYEVRFVGVHRLTGYDETLYAQVEVGVPVAVAAVAGGAAQTSVVAQELVHLGIVVIVAGLEPK